MTSFLQLLLCVPNVGYLKALHHTQQTSRTSHLPTGILSFVFHVPSLSHLCCCCTAAAGYVKEGGSNATDIAKDSRVYIRGITEAVEQSCTPRPAGRELIKSSSLNCNCSAGQLSAERAPCSHFYYSLVVHPDGLILEVPQESSVVFKVWTACQVLVGHLLERPRSPHDSQSLCGHVI